MSTKNQFVIEIDGINQILATKVDGLDLIKHQPAKLMRGNVPNATYGRGNYEVGVVSVSNAVADVLTEQQVNEWHRSYVKGEDVSKRGARVMQMSEDGATPIASYELLDCVPVDFKHEGFDATSNDFAFFNFTFQPEDTQLL